MRNAALRSQRKASRPAGAQGRHCAGCFLHVASNFSAAAPAVALSTPLATNYDSFVLPAIAAVRHCTAKAGTAQQHQLKMAAQAAATDYELLVTPEELKGGLEVDYNYEAYARKRSTATPTTSSARGRASSRRTPKPTTASSSASTPSSRVTIKSRCRSA